MRVLVTERCQRTNASRIKNGYECQEDLLYWGGRPAKKPAALSDI